MAFGFSVGDFVAVTNLIVDIGSSIQDVGGSASEYQELQRELQSLQRALLHVDKLRARPDQLPAINVIKCAALMCRHPLQEFLTSIRKYEDSLGVGKTKGKPLDLKRKTQWGLCKKKAVEKLQNYLNVHIGSINMLLLAHGLEILDLAADRSAADHENLSTRLDASHATLLDVKDASDEQTIILRRDASILGQMFGIINGDILSQLNKLVDLAGKVWHSNLPVYTILLRWQTQLPSPDLKHTWLQDPVRFEDALGRIIPVLSEYDYDTVSAIIGARFQKGPGGRLVADNQYELFDVRNTKSQITKDNWTGFLPGACIKMAVSVGTDYENGEHCPVCSSRSQTIFAASGGGMTW
ncbi:hypothetical protein MMC17_007555 [Xylographa soralifera]|nr:hypothetical protein [Xylographa soralifera]